MAGLVGDVIRDHTTPTFYDSITRARGPLPSTAAIEDEAAIVGSWGGSATARYFADLSRAGIGSDTAFDATHNFSYVGPCDVEVWKRDSGQGQAAARAWDTLHVTLPAGDYGDGVFAELQGRVTGDLAVAGDFFAQAQAVWQVEVRVNGNPLPLVYGDTSVTEPAVRVRRPTVPLGVLTPLARALPRGRVDRTCVSAAWASTGGVASPFLQGPRRALRVE